MPPVKYKCAFTGCREMVRPRDYLCAAHWEGVPYVFQLDVFRTYTPGQPTQEHRAARLMALKVSEGLHNVRRFYIEEATAKEKLREGKANGEA